MNSKPLRCIHRHTIDEHPSCFLKGLVKQEQPTSKEEEEEVENVELLPNEKDWVKETGLPWYQYPGYKVGYLDIETDNLKADFGTILSWAIKEKDGSVFYDFISKDELFSEVNVDKRLVQSLLYALSDYKVIVTYYGTYFDIPWIRTKALHYDLDFPGYGQLFHYDIYFTVKSKLNLSRKSLDSVCDYFGIDGKTHIDKEVWRRAKYGNKAALKEVVEHNIYDVKILEKLHNKIEFTRKWIKTSI